MISSVDTYVYNKIKKTLDVILKDEYIVDNALARLDEETRQRFKDSFAGNNPKREVEVSYQFPQTKEKFDARIVVQMGTGVLAEESLGNVEGTFTYRELGETREVATIKDLGGDRVGVELKHLIGEIVGIEELTFSKHDEVQEDGNILSFSKSTMSELIGMELTIHYIAREGSTSGKDPKGVKMGFTSREQVIITPLSTNMDTARSLDLLLKTVLIIMLESPEEKGEYQLQEHRFQEMQNIIPEPIDRLVFGRPLVVTYTVPHNLDFDYLKEIKEFNFKIR